MKTIVIFSGAGLSQESGVPTFRDSNGLWENHRVEDVASQDGWQRDPSLVLNFYKERFNGVKSVEPNAAHRAIASLEQKYRVINITQNVDDLLERAGCTNVTHLHGTLCRRKCEHHHDISNLDGDQNFQCDYKVEHTTPVELGEKCPKCGGQMRPDVVWFGEAVDINYNKLKDECWLMKRQGGVFICTGTSAQVYPAAYLISFFSQVPHKYIVDMKPIKVSGYTRLQGKAGEMFPALAEALLDGRQLESNIPEPKDTTMDEIREMLTDSDWMNH
jgi:NAD-dependent deacetylase